jgi:myo-inositol 2-dehydrogenase/D-chiro-inositol 1-dehydrogenase
MNEASDLRICIIGAGSLSTKRIYPNIGAAGAELVGVCDLSLEMAQRNARRFGGTPYVDYKTMLATEKPDAVMVCIGPEQHAELAQAIMKMGFPVYTEKPPAATAAAALAVARVSQDTGVLCSTAFKKRYTVAANRAKEWLAKFPETSRYCMSVDYASGQYRNDTPRHTFLLDFAIHIIDLTPYLFGDVAKVFAFAKGPDAFAVSLSFVNGAVGSLSLTDGRTFSMPTEEIELTVKGGNSMTIHNSSCWRIIENEKAVEWREPPTFTSRGDSGNETGHLAEIADFFDAVRTKRTTRSNIYESYKSMVLYEAIRASAETGAIVPVVYEQLSGNKDRAGIAST